MLEKNPNKKVISPELPRVSEREIELEKTLNEDKFCSTEFRGFESND